MQVRYLSGNLAGRVVEMPQTEAEVAISSGFAEVVREAVPAAAVSPLEATVKPTAVAQEENAPKPTRRRRVKK